VDPYCLDVAVVTERDDSLPFAGLPLPQALLIVAA
jgi:hypothetical protein